MPSFGIVYFNIDGTRVSANASVTINNLTGVDTQFESNLDGTLHNMATPAPIIAEISELSANDYPLDDLLFFLRACTGDDEDRTATFGATGACDSNIQTVHFTRMKTGGNISLDLTTGKISGFQLAAGRTDVLVNGTPINRSQDV